MTLSRPVRIAAILIVAATLSACGNRAIAPGATAKAEADQAAFGDNRPRSTLWDLFRPREEAGRLGAVNKYIWNASLEVLDFLPVQSVDPFTGVITTGYGTPPGGGRAYRATIHISDPALEARSLNVAVMTRSGPANAATVRAVEDAILTRARQLRAQDSRL